MPEVLGKDQLVSGLLLAANHFMAYKARLSAE